MHAPVSTLKEEVAHAITHGLGAVLGVIGLMALITVASEHSPTAVWTSVVFGISTILLYSASAAFHGVPADSRPQLKEAFRRLDHSAIYLLIAGTYTPFAVVTVGGWLGWTLLIVVWSLAVVGVLWKVLSGKERYWLSLGLYLSMGWIGLLAVKSLYLNLPAGGLWLLFGGGAAYTVGTVFYAWHKLPLNHVIWHLFVMAGTALHYFAILYYVVPSSA